MVDLQIVQSGVVGNAVKNFNIAETCLQSVGVGLDKLIASEDPSDTLAAASELYLYLTSFQNAVDTYTDEIKTYINILMDQISGKNNNNDTAENEEVNYDAVR